MAPLAFAHDNVEALRFIVDRSASSPPSLVTAWALCTNYACVPHACIREMQQRSVALADSFVTGVTWHALLWDAQRDSAFVTHGRAIDTYLQLCAALCVPPMCRTPARVADALALGAASLLLWDDGTPLPAMRNALERTMGIARSVALQQAVRRCNSAAVISSGGAPISRAALEVYASRGTPAAREDAAILLAGCRAWDSAGGATWETRAAAMRAAERQCALRIAEPH